MDFQVSFYKNVMDTMGVFINEIWVNYHSSLVYHVFFQRWLVSSGLWSSHVWNLKADEQNGRKMLSPRGQDSWNQTNALCHSQCKYISLLLL